MTLLEHIAREACEVFSAEFAEEISYTPAGGRARTVRAIFDRLSEVTDIGEMIEVDGVAAMANCASADVPELAKGDDVIARGLAYKVVGVEPDGTGRTVAVLGI